MAGVSRPTLTRLVKQKTTPTKRVREKVEKALIILERREATEKARKEKRLGLLKERAAEVGQKQLATELGVDRGNLSAVLAGRRRLKAA